MAGSSNSRLAAAFFGPGVPGDDRLNLRLAFGLFLGWMVLLTVAARVGFAYGQAGSTAGLRAWLLCGYLFYLSLCCSFFPAPTSWIVMLMASDYLAASLGLADAPALRLVIVASFGALGTAVANLNEYHILTFILRYRRAARVRQTRLYVLADRWFAIAPFWVLVLVSFLPLPVDVIRWLAVACRYSRWRYFWAYYIGRWLRYGLLAGSTIGLGLQPWHIVAFQVALIVLVAGKLLPGLLRQVRGRRQAPAGQPFEALGQRP